MAHLRPARVVCTCIFYGCSSQSFIDDFGQHQPGKIVPISTRTYHRKRDLNQDPQPGAPPLVPQVESSQSATFQGAGYGQRMRPDLRDNENSIASIKQSLFMLVCMLAAWLHLACGLSRDATSKMLKILGAIVYVAVELGFLITRSSQQLSPDSTHSRNHSSIPLLPRDVRRAMSALSIEPNIVRSICCPKCYSRYTLDSLPQVCLRRETPRSMTCGTKLWTTRSTRGGPRLVPSRLYNTQDFESWLEFFLSRPGIEELIDKSYIHKCSPGVMDSLWDSPAWKSLGDYTITPGNLTFSYYIDWFNPFTNKIAGKSVSCGAIMLFCLNLPYELQHLPENTFFAGITPPPKEPTTTTITAVSDPIVDRLEAMWHGRVIRTHRHPNGIQKRAAILPGIGDLLAMRKAMGFAGVASHHFCSFCLLRRSDIEDLDHQSWQPRNGVDVTQAAVEWREATTKKERKEIFDRSGVRWSSLHRLAYCNPVQHTILGVMHNWIEGVLQHHARIQWGIGVIPSKPDQPADVREDGTSTPPPTKFFNSNELDTDFEMLDEEIEELFEESQRFGDTPSHLKRLHSEALLMQQGNSPNMANEPDPEDSDFQPDLDDDSESESDNKEDESWKAACVFTISELASIHTCLSDAVVPSWLERPPINLGQKSHGKLKADQWLSLFSIFLPLILPEVWSSTSSDERHALLLDNFYNLATCTNIVCAYSVTSASADEYLSHYIAYRQSSKTLFPNIGSRPNHHYAMHNADLMKFWGPLIKLSEFTYEQHNGTLQKIKTNSHVWEMDFTMLKQICRRGRLMALIRDSSVQVSGVSNRLTQAFQIFFGEPDVNTDIQSSDPLAKGLKDRNNRFTEQNLPPNYYTMILTHLNNQEPVSPFRHFRQMPHPTNSYVLPRTADRLHHIKHRSRGYSTFGHHPGNSSISYREDNGDSTNAGHIESIWKQVLNGVLRTFIMVSPHRRLSFSDQALSPYQDKPGFQVIIVYTGSHHSVPTAIIEPDQIIGHVAYYERPPGTFGISQATTVLIDSLHRKRT